MEPAEAEEVVAVDLVEPVFGVVGERGGLPRAGVGARAGDFGEGRPRAQPYPARNASGPESRSRPRRCNVKVSSRRSGALGQRHPPRPARGPESASGRALGRLRLLLGPPLAERALEDLPASRAL